MMSLAVGLIAACAWAVHDLLVRKIGQEAPLLPMMVIVLATGCAVLALPSALWGDWASLTAPALLLTLASGFSYALGMGGLYRAFSMAPVRLVAPILGAYPMISLALAALDGRAISAEEMLAVLAIVAGIAVVGLTGHQEGRIERPFQAMFWAAAGAIGFATTFWFGQAAARMTSELPVILIGRTTALVVILGLCGATGARLGQLGGTWRILAMIGVFDGLALALVTASAKLPHPEYAAISSSLFGVLTILLAWRFLKEAVLPWQWLGIGTVFAGVAALSSLG